MAARVDYDTMLASISTSLQAGDSPTDALYKAACSGGLNEPQVEYLAGLINNGRTLAHVFKSAGTDRLSTFALADAAAVMERINKDDKKTSTPAVKKQAKSAFAAPAVRKVAMSEPVAPKEKQPTLAEYWAEGDHVEAECRTLLRRLHKAYSEDAAKSAADAKHQLGAVSKAFGKMKSTDRERFARRFVNRYGNFGENVVNSVCHSASVELAMPARSAQTCTMPAEPVYIHANNLVESIRKAAHHKAVAASVLHCADSFLEDFLANTAALAVRSPGVNRSELGSRMQTYDRQRGIDEVEDSNNGLSVAASARLKALRTRRAFFSVVADDPNLRTYPLGKLTQAFNDVIQTDPRMLNSPPRLRGAMMQTIQSPVMDPFMHKLWLEASDKAESVQVSRAKKEEATQKALTDKADSVASRLQTIPDAIAKTYDENRSFALQKAEDRQKATDKRNERLTKIKTGIGSAYTGLTELRKEYKTGKDANTVAARFVQSLDPKDLNDAVAAGGFSSAGAYQSALADNIKSDGPTLDILKAQDPVVAATKVAEERLKAAKETADKKVLVDKAMVEVNKHVSSLSPGVLNSLMTSGGFTTPEEYKQSLAEAVVADKVPEELKGTMRSGLQRVADQMKADRDRETADYTTMAGQEKTESELFNKTLDYDPKSIEDREALVALAQEKGWDVTDLQREILKGFDVTATSVDSARSANLAQEFRDRREAVSLTNRVMEDKAHLRDENGAPVLITPANRAALNKALHPELKSTMNADERARANRLLEAEDRYAIQQSAELSARQPTAKQLNKRLRVELRDLNHRMPGRVDLKALTELRYTTGRSRAEAMRVTPTLMAAAGAGDHRYTPDQVEANYITIVKDLTKIRNDPNTAAKNAQEHMIIADANIAKSLAEDDDFYSLFFTRV